MARLSWLVPFALPAQTGSSLKVKGAALSPEGSLQPTLHSGCKALEFPSHKGFLLRSSHLQIHLVMLNSWSNWHAGLGILQIIPLQNRPRALHEQHCSEFITISAIIYQPEYRALLTNKANSTTFRHDSQQKLTWLFGSPSKLHICGTILLSVKLWAPDLGIKNKRALVWITEQASVHNAGLQEVLTYALSVAIRQRQIPSLVRKFLCLNPPSILSHTYCGRQKRKWDRTKRRQGKKQILSSSRYTP